MSEIRVIPDIRPERLPDKEYHYYQKARSLGRTWIAFAILHGDLTADKIESQDHYAWLAD